ncbi:adenosine deaminase [Falsiroseomonas selenitidurans]|uniref:Adenine deaminase n=1 Tax=Falsiroseomonas selenitidurans TaxID=2716335 RepID=A0ABX1E9K8_9PROT|nr:adenosine deaminase [Falsiroseomonas selenitidurans]NKC33546.1 adenosine deaminase [Falsiroseomonas selenitidurans]
MPLDLNRLIDRMPKAELHMHLEGSLEPELLFALARRNGVEIGFDSEEALRAAYSFTKLQDFLDIFYAGLRVLRTERDFHEMTLAYLRRVRQDNVLHAEVFISPQAHTRRGIPFEAMFEGVDSALRQAERDLGMTAGLILGFQRQFDESDAFDVVRQAKPYADRFVGFGMGGPELGNPPAKFARVFAACRAAGHKVVAHAGEEGPAQFVCDAVDLLKLDRVDHGVRCADDPELVKRLAGEGVPLTVCPCSNIKLRVFDRMQDHNLATLLRAGVKVTINSDDPSYFGGYMNENFRQAATALDLTEAELYRLARNGMEAAFVTPARRAELLAALDGAWRDETGGLPA